MTVEAILEEIGNLPETEQRRLFDSLGDLMEEAWDREIERDFAPGGRGAHLVAKVNRQIDEAIANGTLISLDDGLRARRQARNKK